MGGNALWDRKKPSFGFISTRLAGLDGVSLETQKWADVMRTKGSRVYYMAGELDTDPSVSHTAPKHISSMKKSFACRRPFLRRKSEHRP